MNKVRVIGAGLAGSECALQLAESGIHVDLYDMKPHKKTPAQKLDGLCELVCSNSFRSTKTTNAVALLKDEMLLLNGFLMRLARDARVAAGDAWAVDREVFSHLVESALLAHPNISIIREEVLKLPCDTILTVIATGPLTSDALAEDLVKFIGQEQLAFYDAIAPIIETGTIDMSKAFLQSRWHEGEEQGDYINCPMDKNTYEALVGHMINSSRAKMHEFEKAHYFEGCLPLEVMAERGIDTLRFGPLKPVGLYDPHTNERPYAVIQLRKEDKYGQSYNMVGCQTRMTISEQQAAFKLIPALKEAQFMRFGSIHRNTYVNGPVVLDEYLRLKDSSGQASNIFLAGQISGVEGYVESMAMGLVVSCLLRAFLNNSLIKFPAESALGALYGHVLGHHRARATDSYVPSNITWAMMPPMAEIKRSAGRALKRQALYDRGIEAIRNFAAGSL